MNQISILLARIRRHWDELCQVRSTIVLHFVFLVLCSDNNLLLTERVGRTGSTDRAQYGTSRVSSLLNGTRALNFPDFERK